MPLPAKIISGGQFGADLGALRAGLILGIPTGGLMPRNFMTELGPRPWYDTQYGMTEHPSSLYRLRTIANAEAADLSLLFGEWRSRGSLVLRETIAQTGKPLLVNPSVAALRELVERLDPLTTINVAGNRETGNRGIGQYVTAVLVDAWVEFLPPVETEDPTRYSIDPTKLRAGRMRATAPYPTYLPKLPEWTGEIR